MPHEDSDVTCPYLRQQMIDRHACQIADPEIGRDVLSNLECLKEADNLLEIANELARYGFLTEAMICCDLAANRCPGSPCAARAVDTLNELALGIIPPTTDIEESAEPQLNETTGPGSQDAEPGVEPMVFDLMKACHLLMNQGMQHQAAELARQAFALDPQRVLADPLVYKMHLLAESPPTPAGSSEESEPPTCPYCPSIGKPIREIVPDKKKSEDDGPATFLVPSLPPPIDYEVVPALDGVLTETAGSEEASEKVTLESIREQVETLLGDCLPSPIDVGITVDGGLRVSGECSLGEHVYHLRYTRGCLAIWTTTDASRTKP
jgi:hypothetical protein